MRIPLTSERGITLMEVLVSIFLLGLVSVGMAHLYVFGMVQINVQGHKRAAVERAQQRLEELYASQYDSVVARTETNLSIGNIFGTRTTTVEAVDDSADFLGGADTDGDTEDYREVTVAVSWTERGKADSVVFETVIAP